MCHPSAWKQNPKCDPFFLLLIPQSRFLFNFPWDSSGQLLCIIVITNEWNTCRISVSLLETIFQSANLWAPCSFFMNLGSECIIRLVKSCCLYFSIYSFWAILGLPWFSPSQQLGPCSHMLSLPHSHLLQVEWGRQSKGKG